MANQPYYGKYRAKVVDVKDPQKRGRIRVICPKVLGSAKSAWCEPCIPVAYDHGGDFALPKVGEFVWVEFESGDSNKPIYTGGLWSVNNSPSESYDVGTRIISWGNCKITMNNDTVEIKIGNTTFTVTYNGVYVNGKPVSTSS